MSFVEQHMRESLKNHELIVWVDDPHCKAWYLMDRKQGRMMGCLILFTQEGIAIQGDIAPGHNGIVSTIGYNEQWFATYPKLSEDYLCSKFLKKVFSIEKALTDLKRKVLEYRRGDCMTKEKAREAWDILEDNDEFDQSAVSDFHWEYFGDYPEGIGIGYDEGDAGWLCCIQQKFAELYGRKP